MHLYLVLYRRTYRTHFSPDLREIQNRLPVTWKGLGVTVSLPSLHFCGVAGGHDADKHFVHVK